MVHTFAFVMNLQLTRDETLTSIIIISSPGYCIIIMVVQVSSSVGIVIKAYLIK